MFLSFQYKGFFNKKYNFFNRRSHGIHLKYIWNLNGSRAGWSFKISGNKILQLKLKYQRQMRKQYDYDQWGQNFRTSTQFNQTPRGTTKPNIPIDTSRRSTTPSRIQDRVSNSPLKAPLQNAISKAAKTRENDFERTSMNRAALGKSSRRNQSPIVSMTKKIYYDEDPEAQQQKAHPETLSFIKKHFESMNLEVPLQRFIQKIMQEYQTLWGNQNAQKIFDDFTYKITDIFGHDYVDLRELARVTKEDGMIGLILRIFKEIKNEENTRSSNYVSFSQTPQAVNISRSFQERLAENESTSSLKNVVQQFMESMYQAMQNEIYQKFNVEMRRMIVKYREAEKLLKKVNEKINSYADVFDFDSKLKQREKKYEAMIEELTKERDRAVTDFQKEKDASALERKEKDKLNEEITRLKETLEKYQNVVLTKAMENNSTQASLLRQNSNQSRVNEKSQPMKTSQINSGEPFKITIDTHVIHKQNMLPETKTFTNFHNVPMPMTGPIQRESYDTRSVHFVTPSPFTTSRVTTYRPLSPTPLSPYQSRIARPL